MRHDFHGGRRAGLLPDLPNGRGGVVVRAKQMPPIIIYKAAVEATGIDEDVDGCLISYCGLPSW